MVYTHSLPLKGNREHEAFHNRLEMPCRVQEEPSHGMLITFLISAHWFSFIHQACNLYLNIIFFKYILHNSDFQNLTENDSCHDQKSNLTVKRICYGQSYYTVNAYSQFESTSQTQSPMESSNSVGDFFYVLKHWIIRNM